MGDPFDDPMDDPTDGLVDDPMDDPTDGLVDDPMAEPLDDPACMAGLCVSSAIISQAPFYEF